MQTMQNMIPCNLAFLAIAAIFYSWRDIYLHRARVRADAREKRLERVANLLWAAANGAERPDWSSSPVASQCP